MSSEIEWLWRPGFVGESWNPVVGCSAVSPGCAHCYAERFSGRLESIGHRKYAGLTVLTPKGRQRSWSGVVRCVEADLDRPLDWRTPRMIFVNSMSDLFHEDVPMEFIWKCLDVIRRCPQHQFLVLTKRAKRMENLLLVLNKRAKRMENLLASSHEQHVLPNLWLGVSVEDEVRARERVPHLRATAAAVRFVSVEPMLGPVSSDALDGVDFAILGGESGPGARPYVVEDAWGLMVGLMDRGIKVFHKQMGASPIIRGKLLDWPPGTKFAGARVRLKDGKGKDPNEWPACMRVREWPAVRMVGAGS